MLEVITLLRDEVDDFLQAAVEGDGGDDDEDNDPEMRPDVHLPWAEELGG